MLKDEERGITDSGVFPEDSQQGRFGVALEEHGSVDQVLNGSLEGGPAKILRDSAGPKISVPFRTRPGTAATI